MRYRELIKNTDFEDKKVLELLLIDYFNISKNSIIKNEICDIDMSKYRLMVDDLKTGRPYQYVVGFTNFYGYNLKVNENVLIPRFDTEGLVEEVILRTKEFFPTPKILDLCTGSGAIAIALAKELKIAVDASDISNDALAVAKENAQNLSAQISFYQSDLFNSLNQKYNIIVSNPPYICDNEVIDKAVWEYEPHIALYAGEKGLDIYERILKECQNYLEDKYLIAFEIGMLQANDIKELVNKYLDNVTIEVKNDLQGRNRYLFVTNV